jgi:glycolate oxidase FAD binding subunit
LCKQIVIFADYRDPMMDTKAEMENGVLAESLEQLIGPENVTRSPDTQIDGLRPAMLLRPGTRGEAARCLETCSRSGAVIIPAGMMTWLECGNPIRSAHVVMSLSRMNRVVEYSPADLTICAEAGITLSELNSTVRNENQWLPLDPPGNGTLGAVVACGSSGPLRFGFGTPRDYVIGLRLAHVDGTETKSGGRVVKNVAGYDLNKLYIGSFGTLAVITEIIVKLRPVPERSATALATAPDTPSLQTLASRLVNNNRIRPASLFVLNQGMSSRLGLSERGGSVLARFVESDAAVSDQLDRLMAVPHDIECAITTVDGDDADLWRKIADFDETIVLKCSVAVSSTRRALELCESRFPEAIVAADIGMGLVRIGIETGDLEMIGRIRSLRADVESVGGSLIIERAPSFTRLEADAWGDAGPEIRIMRAIKQRYDPNSLLSPGRFVAGI